MGLYFAQISSEGVCEAVESADAYIFIGPTFNDYSTCAFSHLLSESKMVRIDQRRVTVAGKQTFGCVSMAEFLPELAKELKPNDTTWQVFKRTYVGPGKVPSNGKEEPLKGKILYSHLQVSLASVCAWCSCISVLVSVAINMHLIAHVSMAESVRTLQCLKCFLIILQTTLQIFYSPTSCHMQTLATLKACLCILQDWLHDDVTLLTDTGDAQFNAMKLKLPEKAG